MPRQKIKERRVWCKMTDKNISLSLITSRQNPTVKRLCALLDKKARRRERAFRFDGIKLLCEAARIGVEIELIALCESAEQSVKHKVISLIEDAVIDKDSVICVSEQVFEKISEESSPEGVITVAKFIDSRHKIIENAEDYILDNNARLLIAESLRDPGNLGTVIRSSAALGIDRLIITDDCADLYNPKTVRAAMGGLFRLDIDVVKSDQLPLLIADLRSRGRRIYATAFTENAKKIGSFELRSGDAFVIGNEGHGLSRATIDAADEVALIPMTEGSESLNAAAAAAICIWETVRSK